MIFKQFLNKRALVLAVTAAAIGIVISVAAGSSAPTKAVDSPINETVAHQGERLDNHEARITNTESDVKDLQDKTGTPPSVTRVEVPVVSPAPAPSAPAPAVTPVTVATAALRVANNGNHFCDLTYSDGSTESKPSMFSMDVFGHNSWSDNCEQFVGQAK